MILLALRVHAIIRLETELLHFALNISMGLNFSVAHLQILNSCSAESCFEHGHCSELIRCIWSKSYHEVAGKTLSFYWYPLTGLSWVLWNFSSFFEEWSQEKEDSTARTSEHIQKVLGLIQIDATINRRYRVNYCSIDYLNEINRNTWIIMLFSIQKKHHILVS